MGRSEQSGEGSEIVVRRVIPASRESIFAAWLDPESLARFMCPGTVHHASAQVDPRVGGSFRIVMEHGEEGSEHWGEYLVIEPPARLSFTWISRATELRPSIVTIELFERGDATEVVLTHRGLPPRQVDPHRNGWGDILRKLGDLLSPTG